MLKTNSLTPEVKAIIVSKGTEYCHSGVYNDFNKDGTYLCRNCGIALFSSKDKFHSNSGWPSFDQETGSNVKKLIDEDKIRMELLCNRCDAHLGHIFYGEGYTRANTRYCINSLALDFIPYLSIIDTEEAIVAAGCFWGVEHLFKKLKGVLKAESGYTGGFIDNPSYKLVCNDNTGHLEAVRIVYDPRALNYSQVIKYFFEIHNFTQTDGQGGDIGPQYLSKIFYYNQEQLNIASSIIYQLQDKGYKVATTIVPVTTFWSAEEYHQDYYHKTGDQPYCHIWKKIF